MNKIIFSILILLFIQLTTAHAQVEVFSEQISLGTALNSFSDEAYVVVSPDESQIYFTRKNHPDNVGGASDPGDIWMSEHQIDGTWSDAENIKGMNTKGMDQFVGFLDLERNVAVYSGKKMKAFHRVSGRWFDSGDIEIEYLKNNGEMFFASISLDAKIMLFGMESFGTYGVEDLYVSFLKADGKWSSPKNLGSQINTSTQEITAFLAADNKTLFFASNGHGGEGSFDIFMSERQDETWQKWSQPKNLGNKINSIGSESAFVLPVEKEFAFLISTQNSEGFGDVKKVRVSQEIEKPAIDYNEEPIAVATKEETNLLMLAGEVRNNVTHRVLIGAEIEISVLPSGSLHKGRTNRMGQFNVNVPQGESYDIKVRAYQYMPAELTVSGRDPSRKDRKSFELAPIVEGNTVALDHVLFKQGESELMEGSEKELDLVVEMMKYNPEITIFLSGHTDNQGKSSLNLQLSKDRVSTVEKYLLGQGVSTERITGQGFGGTKPRASNADPETRKLNRRVEFTIHTKK
ncbi:MAG: OmpA family protein [Reichenbachiella sp.]